MTDAVGARNLFGIDAGVVHALMQARYYDGGKGEFLSEENRSNVMSVSTTSAPLPDASGDGCRALASLLIYRDESERSVLAASSMRRYLRRSRAFASPP